MSEGKIQDKRGIKEERGEYITSLTERGREMKTRGQVKIIMTGKKEERQDKEKEKEKKRE